MLVRRCEICKIPTPSSRGSGCASEPTECTITKHIVLFWVIMTDVVSLWVGLKTSPHTRRAYAAEAARFLEFVGKPLPLVALADLQAWAEYLGQGSLKPASQNRALTAVKSLLAFGHEAGFLPFNVGVAVKLRPNRDGLAARILEEGEIAR